MSLSENKNREPVSSKWRKLSKLYHISLSNIKLVGSDKRCSKNQQLVTIRQPASRTTYFTVLQKSLKMNTRLNFHDKLTISIHHHHVSSGDLHWKSKILIILIWSHDHWWISRRNDFLCKHNESFFVVVVLYNPLCFGWTLTSCLHLTNDYKTKMKLSGKIKNKKSAAAKCSNKSMLLIKNMHIWYHLSPGTTLLKHHLVI